MNETLLVNEVRSSSTGTPGRCLNAARSHHFVIDEPTHAGGPGEEITPAEEFLAGVSACGVLLVESHAKKMQVPLQRVEAVIEGIRQKSDPTIFERVHMRFTLVGPTQDEAEELVAYYQHR